MTQYRTHIADGILRFLKQKQIYITEVFYMHILRVLLQKQSQLRQKLQYESSKVKNRLTRTKSHFGDLLKAPPTLKSSCFFILNYLKNITIGII